MSYQTELEIDFHGVGLIAVVQTDWEWLGDSGIPPEMNEGAELVKLVGCDGDDNEVDAMWMVAFKGSNAAIKKVVDKEIWRRHQLSIS